MYIYDPGIIHDITDKGHYHPIRLFAEQEREAIEREICEEGEYQGPVPKGLIKENDNYFSTCDTLSQSPVLTTATSPC